MTIFSEVLDPLARVKEEYPREEFARLGIPRYALPKMHSHLPDKPHFHDYKSILKLWVYKAFLYRHHQIPSGRVILFTWVMAGGLGDWSTQIAAANIIKDTYPDLDLRLITIIARDEKASFSHSLCPTYLFRYGEPIPPELFLNARIIQIPTYFPEWHKPANSITIGEYGFLDSEWLHPQSGALCMGLHSLEMGLLFGKTSSPLSPIPNQFFAYLYSERGYAVYLHTLLSHHHSDITLYACNPLPLLKVLQSENFRGYNLSYILFNDDTHQIRIPIEEGRTLRIICKKALPHAETQKLILSSQPFTGCRGDRSFTECVLTKKLFFYDPPTHMRPFIHDLIDVAKYYLFPYPTLHDYLKTFLDQKTSPKALGHQIAEFLLDPTLSIGMEKLNKLLLEQFSFDQSLLQLLAPHPEELLNLFLEGKLSLQKLLS